jgi:hypothetical protein
MVARRRKGRRRAERRRGDAAEPVLDTYRTEWLGLTPAERLRRSWRLRSRLRDLESVHDAKSLPEL